MYLCFNEIKWDQRKNQSKNQEKCVQGQLSFLFLCVNLLKKKVQIIYPFDTLLMYW